MSFNAIHDNKIIDFTVYFACMVGLDMHIFDSWNNRALSSNFGKRPLGKIGKIINLLSKLGKVINIKHNYGSKIYPKNQVILDCFMPSTSVIWVIDPHKL